MKQKHAYLKTSVWHRKKIKDPYQAIASAFSFGDIIFFRKLIKGVLLASWDEKIYRRKDPGNLIYEFGELESLINAAYVIVYEKMKSPLSISDYDLLNKSLYCGKSSTYTEWDYFPRGLSKKEYLDPYAAFHNFFRYQPIEDWKKDLKRILDDALTSSNREDALNLLHIYFHLIKLVEAAHLINVREVFHIDGHLKNRF